MTAKRKILLASRSKPAVAALAAKLSKERRYELQTRVLENGHTDPLHGLNTLPDVVVFALDERGHDDLNELTKQSHLHRPPLIVTASEGDSQTMRLAMQAGARDFLPGALGTDDLVASIERAAAQTTRTAQARASSLIAVVNAKGGSGATFVASNVAHIMNALWERSTAIMSLDVQFESLVPFFDVTLKHGLMDVLESARQLDAVALDAFMTTHHSGLRLLAPHPEGSFENLNDHSGDLATLLDKMTAQYERVVVDIPRRVDRYTGEVLERSTRVLLVVQQSLSHLRDAKRMMQIFKQYGLDPKQVLVVVNPFEKSSMISIEDVERALPGSQVMNVPSDFKTVAESINLGVPMYAHARNSAVTRALTVLAKALGGRDERQQSGGLLGKALSGLLRKETW